MWTREIGGIEDKWKQNKTKLNSVLNWRTTCIFIRVIVGYLFGVVEEK